jgi:hypothetical protein
VHSGQISKTYLGTAETGAYETTIYDFMQDTATWKASRPLQYLVPFKELDKNSRCSILHTNASNKRFNSEYEIKVAAAMIRYR